MGTSHALSGATVWLAGCATATTLGAHPSLATIGAGAVVTAAGALIPDLDHPKSLASRSFWPFTAVLSVATRATSRLIYRATSTAHDDQGENCGTHRALTHTAAFACSLAAVASSALLVAGRWWPPLTHWSWLGLTLGLGCLVHTAGDWLTHAGVPLLWPLTWRGKRWWRFRSPLSFRTNGPVEHFLAVPLFAVAGLGSVWLLLDSLAPVRG